MCLAGGGVWGPYTLCGRGYGQIVGILPEVFLKATIGLN